MKNCPVVSAHNLKKGAVILRPGSLGESYA